MAKYQKLDGCTELCETPLTAGPDGTYALPVHDAYRWGPFIGVSLDSNILSLLGTVAKIGGAF